MSVTSEGILTDVCTVQTGKRSNVLMCEGTT